MVAAGVRAVPRVQPAQSRRRRRHRLRSRLDRHGHPAAASAAVAAFVAAAGGGGGGGGGRGSAGSHRGRHGRFDDVSSVSTSGGHRWPGLRRRWGRPLLAQCSGWGAEVPVDLPGGRAALPPRGLLRRGGDVHGLGSGGQLGVGGAPLGGRGGGLAGLGGGAGLVAGRRARLQVVVRVVLKHCRRHAGKSR